MLHMICRVCNSYMNDDSVFCTYCGAPVSGSENPDMPRIIIPEGQEMSGLSQPPAIRNVPMIPPPPAENYPPVQRPPAGGQYPPVQQSPVGREHPPVQRPPIGREHPPVQPGQSRPQNVTDKARPNSIKPAAGQKKPSQRKLPIILLSSALGVALITIGIGLYLYFSRYSDWEKERSLLMSESSVLKGSLESTQTELENTKLNLSNTEKTLAAAQADLSNTQEDLKKANDTITSLNTQVENLGKEKKELESQVKTLNEDKAKLQTELNTSIEKYDQIDNGATGLTPSSKVYFPNKNVVFLKKGETDTIIIHDSIPGQHNCEFKRNNKNAEGDWKDDWDSVNHCCTLSVKAGNTPGTTTFDFTNTANDAKFQILVVITE